MGNGACCSRMANACLKNELDSDINCPKSDNHSFTYISNDENKINKKYQNPYDNKIIYQSNIYPNNYSDNFLTKSPEKPLCTSVKQIYPPIKHELYDSQPIIQNTTPNYHIQYSEKIEKIKPYTFKEPIETVITSPYKNNIQNNKDNNQTDITNSQNDNFHYQTNNNNQNNKINNNNQNKLQNIYLKFSKFGEPKNDNDFSLDGWKEFYPLNDPFFNWNKGYIIPNQLLIKNPDSEDISKIEIYSGETNNYDQKHGFGTLTNYQFVQKGTWRNDNFTGWGRESRRNGVTLEGKFIDGFVTGKGILKNNIDNEYKGDFVKNIREGKGILKTSKFIYEGDFKNNVLCGNGKINFIEDGHFYEGEFNNNNIEGKGIFKWKNGDIYEGYMKNGKMDGYGTYKYFDGDFYEGYYINGLKNGKGKFVSNLGKETYEGEFKNGKPNGKGILIKDGKSKNVEFNDGKMVKGK